MHEIGKRGDDGVIEGMRRVDVTSLPPRKSIAPMLGTLEWPLESSQDLVLFCQVFSW